MKKGLSEIVLVLDRSGSMSSTKSDAEGGLREFIEKQRVLPGQCDVTFYRFDNEIERVFDKKPIERVENAELTLEPRGSTALLDAMARAIDEVGKRLSNTPESERPEHVYFVTITDGFENASTKNSTAQVFSKVSHQRDRYKWEFIYIGANQDAITSAAAIGINSQFSLTYNASARGMANTYAALHNTVSTSRTTGTATGFTNEDRIKSMEN